MASFNTAGTQTSSFQVTCNSCGLYLFCPKTTIMCANCSKSYHWSPDTKCVSMPYSKRAYNFLHLQRNLTFHCDNCLNTPDYKILKETSNKVLNHPSANTPTKTKAELNYPAIANDSSSKVRPGSG